MNPASQIPATTAAIVAILVLAQFKKLINRFRNSGATSPKTAKTLEDLNIYPRRMFRRLLNRGVINEAGSGRYYLNEGNLEEYKQVRRIRMIIIFGILILLFLMGIFVFKY
jgi:hypothetical protein